MSKLYRLNTLVGPSQRKRERPATNDSVLRAIGVVSLLAIGTIHFLQIVPTTESTPLLGVSFLALIAASLWVAAGLAMRGDRRIWMASALVCVAAIGGYAFTRTFSTPLDNQDAGNWSCMLGLAALFVETTLLGFSTYAARIFRPREELALAAPARSRSGQKLAGDPDAA